MTKDDTQKKDQQEEVEVAETHVPEEESDTIHEELKEAEEKYKRALADYQNLEKRVVEDRREWIRQANRELLLRILPTLDTLMLATKHSEDKSLHVSVQQFLDILKSEGVTKVETAGQKFDPILMEAVGTAEGDEGKVVEEARAGFMLYERLLRPAQVIVGKAKS